MGIQLGESLHCLPVEEIRRLQRVLRVILNHPGRENLRRVVRGALDRLGLPFDFNSTLAQEAQLSFDRLLGAFGRLSTAQMSEAERGSLLRSPLTIWPAADLCTVSAEVMQRLAGDHRIRRRGYLFAHLHNLPARERRGWSRWLEIGDARNDRERQHRIYRRAAELQADLDPTQAQAFEGRFLDEFFSDNPLEHPIAWHYRGVLGLYDALGETESRGTYTEETQALLALLKAGRLVAKEQPAPFGQRNRLRLVETRERPLQPASSLAFPDLANLASTPVREQSLF